MKNSNAIVTTHKGSLRRLCFYTCLFVQRGICRPTPGGAVEGSGRGVSRPTARGEVEESGWGVARPTPRVGDWGVWLEGPRPTPWGVPGPHQGVSRPRPGGRGCIPACTEADPPPQADGYCCGRECILVLNVFQTLFNLLLRCYVVMGVGLLWQTV